MTNEEREAIIQEGYETEEDIVVYQSIQELMMKQELIRRTRRLHKKITIKSQ